MPIDFGFIEDQEGLQPDSNLPAVSMLDIESAKKRFAKYREEIDKMRVEVASFEVKTQTDAEQLTAMLGQAATLRDSMEKKRKMIIEEPDKFVRSFNSFVKGFRDGIDNLLKVGKKKIGDFSYLQELERREKERKANEAARKQQEELDRIAKEKKVAPIVIEQQVVPKKTGPIRTESGKSSTKYVWTWELLDRKLDSVPREYLTIDPKEVERAIQAGIRDIPGIRIYEKPIVSIMKG